MTREQADTLLADQPRGTFLRRFGSQGGQLVLSVRSAGAGAAPPTTHYLLALTALQARPGCAALPRGAAPAAAALPLCPAPPTLHPRPARLVQHNGLEALLERNGAAEVLLDAATGQRHARASVLDRAYLQMADLAEARKRLRWVAGRQGRWLLGRVGGKEGGRRGVSSAEAKTTPTPSAPTPAPPRAAGGSATRRRRRLSQHLRPARRNTRGAT